MIVFDLDGTLALNDHRKHFVDPEKNNDFFRYNGNDFRSIKCGIPDLQKKFIPNWNAFFEACDKDLPNRPICEIFLSLAYIPYKREIAIWSGRSEAVREKTLKWIEENIPEFEGINYINRILKMRPIGDFTPDEILKEKWLDEALAIGKEITMVFDDRKKVVDMWRRRGITCLQVAKGDF